MSNISFNIKQGESIGILGPSGSGKSTLVDLILGLLEETSGEITVDGVNINTCMRQWQDQIGYVPQTIYLLDDSILHNIAFGIPNDKIDFQAVEKALIAAQLEDYIKHLPDGINTYVGERGVRLSGAASENRYS